MASCLSRGLFLLFAVTVNTFAQQYYICSMTSILLPELLFKHSDLVLVPPEYVLVVVAAADVVGYPDLDNPPPT